MRVIPVEYNIKINHAIFALDVLIFNFMKIFKISVAAFVCVVCSCSSSKDVTSSEVDSIEKKTVQTDTLNSDTVITMSPAVRELMKKNPPPTNKGKMDTTKTKTYEEESVIDKRKKGD